MKRGVRATWIAVALIVGSTVSQTAMAQPAKPEIIHDAEYYILATQHGEQWAAEDQDLNRKLAELRQK
jgi:arylsulfatase